MKKLKLVQSESQSLAIERGGVNVAQVSGLSEEGSLMILLHGHQPVEARMTTRVSDMRPESLIGQQVLVVYEGGDQEKPIAMDLMQPSGGFAEALRKERETEKALDVKIDGETIRLEAKKKIELRVGKASIVINEDGKITVRGAHLLNRATGPIRIKGGHVDIN